jgi:putative NADH-flavin reductase
MKIAIVGATGRTGKPLTRKALDNGHEVYALVRTPSKMDIQHDNLTCIEGDAMNPADVENVVQHAEVVINVIGHGKNTPDDLMTRSADNIIKAMETHDTSRLVTLTGAGVQMPGDTPKFMDNFVRGMLFIFARRVAEDSVNYVDRVKQSDVDWTIVRAPRLVEAEPKGTYNVGRVGGDNMSISIPYDDLATFILSVAESGEYLREAPMVSS